MADKISLDLITTVRPGSLITNFKELKTQIDAKMKQYENYVAIDENLSIVKSELAKIRKLKKSMNDNFKGIDKEYNFPLDQAKLLFKELLSSVEKAEKSLDVQVKEIEKENQKKLISERTSMFKERIFEEDLDFQDYIKKCKVWIIPDNWKTKSLSLKAVNTHIETTIENIKTAMNAFENNRFKKELLKDYASHGNFQQTFNLMQSKEDEYNRMNALREQEELQKSEELRLKKIRENNSENDTKKNSYKTLMSSEDIHKRQAEAYKRVLSSNEEKNTDTIKKDYHQIPAIEIPQDPKKLEVCVLGINFKGERYKIQAILDIAKAIGLGREPRKSN